eukprot:8225306-Pyramimonas_sp.AAC.1
MASGCRAHSRRGRPDGLQPGGPPDGSVLPGVRDPDGWPGSPRHGPAQPRGESAAARARPVRALGVSSQALAACSSRAVQASTSPRIAGSAG